DGPAVGRAESDAGPDGEAGGAGCPDGDIQPGRGGEDALAGAAYGSQGEQRRRGSDAADVRDSGATTGLWSNADAAGECAPAPIGDRAAVLSLSGAGRGRADAADVRDTAAPARLRGGADAAGERPPAAVGNRAAVLSLGGAGRGSARDDDVGDRPPPASRVRHPADRAAEAQIDRAAGGHGARRDEVDR